MNTNLPEVKQFIEELSTTLPAYIRRCLEFEKLPQSAAKLIDVVPDRSMPEALVIQLKLLGHTIGAYSVTFFEDGTYVWTLMRPEDGKVEVVINSKYTLNAGQTVQAVAEQVADSPNSCNDGVSNDTDASSSVPFSHN